MNIADMICNGEIVAPHGVRGEIRLLPFSDDLERYLGFKQFYLENGQLLEVESIKPHKRLFLVRFSGVNDANAAQLLRGTKVYVHRNLLPKLPEGEYFRFEMIGLKVYHVETGEELGTLENIISTGGTDVYEVRKPDGKAMLFPAIADVVKVVDVSGCRMEILPQKEL